MPGDSQKFETTKRRAQGGRELSRIKSIAKRFAFLSLLGSFLLSLSITITAYALFLTAKVITPVPPFSTEFPQYNSEFYFKLDAFVTYQEFKPVAICLGWLCFLVAIYDTFSKKCPKKVQLGLLLVGVSLLEFYFVSWVLWINGSTPALITTIIEKSLSEQHTLALLLLINVIFLALARFGTLSATVQISSASMLGLPMMVYFFDHREFHLHFVSGLGDYSWITNENLLFILSAALIGSTLYSLRPTRTRLGLEASI